MASFTVVTEEERRAIIQKTIDAYYNGASQDELYRLGLLLPIQPCLAKSFKESRGLQALLDSDFNLSDAIKEFGHEFIER